MKKIFVFVILTILVILSEIVYSQEITNIIQPIDKLPGIIYSKAPEIIDFKNVDIQKYVLVSQFDNIEVQSISNILKIDFFGGIDAVYQDKRLKCDSLTIFVIDNTVRQIIGVGNVKFKSGKDIFEGEKFFYDLTTGKISMYNARTKLDDQFYYADILKQMSPTKFFFENVYFTKSDLLFPTYKVNAYRVWYYRDDYLLSINNSYILGGASFIYFPTYFELYRYTDILTDFGVENTIGFYIQNTYYPVGWFGERIFPRIKLKFDHYERLGEYFGIEIPTANIISNLNINANIDLEYDKKYEAIGRRIFNYIDQYGKNDYREYRTFGWYYRLNLSYNASGTSISFSTEDLNDPFLPSKFSSRREKLDVRKLLFPYENTFWSLPGPKQNITRSFKLNYQYGISSFSLSMDWVYQLRSGYSTTNTNSFGIIIIENKTNKYANDYYRYDLQRFTGPTITYSISLGDIISLSYDEKITNITQTTNLPPQPTKFSTNERIISKQKFTVDMFVITTNITTNISTNLIIEENNTNYSLITNFLENITTNLSINTNLLSTKKEETTGTNINIRTNILSFNWFNFKVSPTFNISLNPNSIYRIEDGSPLEESFSHTENIGINANLSTLNNFLSIGSSLGVRNHNIWTKTDNPIRRKQDDLNSIATMNLGNSLSLGRSIFEDKVFLIEPRISVSHNLSYRITKPKLLSPEEDIYIDDITSHSVSTGISLRIFNLSLLSNDVLNFIGFNSISFSTRVSYNLLYLKNEIKYIQDRNYWTNKISNPIGFSFSFGPWLNYNISYRIKISNDITVFDPVVVSLSGSLSIRELPLPVLINKISYLTFSYGTSFDYVNPINNNFVLNLSIGGIIDENWSFAISTSVVNNKLFRYVPEYAQRYNQPPIDLLQDIIDAINIFDINALRRTSFKNRGINISLIRDLYDWTASISGGIRLYKDDINNFAFFEPFLKFEVISKKSIGIETPPIQPELYRLYQPTQ